MDGVESDRACRLFLASVQNPSLSEAGVVCTSQYASAADDLRAILLHPVLSVHRLDCGVSIGICCVEQCLLCNIFLSSRLVKPFVAPCKISARTSALLIGKFGSRRCEHNSFGLKGQSS